MVLRSATYCVIPQPRLSVAIAGFEWGDLDECTTGFIRDRAVGWHARSWSHWINLLHTPRCSIHVRWLVPYVECSSNVQLGVGCVSDVNWLWSTRLDYTK
jgi:hypothetical protein